jgi:hypothetical protein
MVSAAEKKHLGVPDDSSAGGRDPSLALRMTLGEVVNMERFVAVTTSHPKLARMP